NARLPGGTRARRSRRKSASSDRRAVEGGGASPTIDALLVATPNVADPVHMTNLGTFTVNRIGFGAMQLAGPGVFGPPRDPAAARAVLRRAVELGRSEERRVGEG